MFSSKTLISFRLKKERQERFDDVGVGKLSGNFNSEVNYSFNNSTILTFKLPILLNFHSYSK